MGQVAPAAPPAEAAAPQAAAQALADVQGGTIMGAVTTLTTPDSNGKQPAGVPLPGVTVTATNTLTGRKYTAATDASGNFRMTIPRNGRYVVRAEFVAFAPATTEVLLNATQHAGTATFALELASRAAVRTAQAGGSSAALASVFGGNTQTLARGLQSLRAAGTDDSNTESASSGGGAEGTALPSLASLGGGDSTGSDSVAISGQAGQTNGLAGLNEDDVRERIQTAIAEAQRNGGAQADIVNAVVGLVGGLMAGGPGFGGPGGGFGGRGGPGGGATGGGGFGRGNFRNFNPNQIHGNLYYQEGNSALDATQFSVTGLAFKPAYNTNRFGLSFTGSPYIPGLIKPSNKQVVFLNLTGQRNVNPFNTQVTVPTLLQRQGNFNGLTQPVNGATTAVTLFNPLTGLPYGDCTNPANPTCNVIPTAQISPQAQALLAYIPLPNVASTGATGSENQYNYQRIATVGNNSTQLSLRYQRGLGASAGQGGFGGRGGGGGGGRGQGGNRQSQAKVLRQNVSSNFTYSHTASDLRGLLPSLDGKTSSNGLSLSATYSIGYGRLSNNLSASWNFSHALTTNAFTYGSLDPASAAGITIPRPPSAKAGLYNGVPDLSFTNFASINETNPSDALGSTVSLSDVVSWRHGKQNFRFGFDGRRAHSDLIAGTNGIGQFVFSGLNTQRPSAGTSTDQSPSGNSFADFLLGAPQNSSIQAGTNKIYLREWVYDGYAQDDWRLLPNVTLNLGLRYEYFSPFVEKYNRLVNLDPSANLQNYAQVLPDGRGTYSSAQFPRSLVNPDRSLLSPRIGVAWRPKWVKNTVVRTGYGINYNTGQFRSFANSLSYQPPFAVTQNNVSASQGCGTFLSGFTLTNAFSCTSALTNNFAVNRLYRLGQVQVMNLDIQHQFPLGIIFNVGYNNAFGGNLDMRRSPNRTLTGTSGNANNIIYEDSIGESRFNALTINARKRLQKGVSLQATYQYGHSIDNASSVNGSGSNTIPQNDQRLDLEFGNSTFDVRHKLTGNFVTELPFGPGRAFLKTGKIARALDGIFVSGDFTFATGSYATPQYQNSVAQAAAGNNFTLRPDRVFSQPISGPGNLRNWFNKNAFTAPANGYGTASRNSIELPGIVGIDASLSKSVDFGELRNLEARITASNVFNTVQYSGVNTVLNSSNFGQVTGAAAPRKLSMQARYRF